MNKLLIILLFISYCQAAYCQQFAVKKYSRHEGLKEYRGTYKVTNGLVKHNYAYYVEGNFVFDDEESFSCNPNVKGEVILNVIDAIDNAYSGLVCLNRISFDDEESDNEYNLKKALDYIGNAVSYYEKAACKEGYEIFSELNEKLQKAKRIFYYKEKIIELMKLSSKYRDYENVNCNLINRR